MANQFVMNKESIKMVVKPLYLARGQQRLVASSRKLLALGEVGFCFVLFLSWCWERCRDDAQGCCQPQGLSLQTEELHPA